MEKLIEIRRGRTSYIDRSEVERNRDPFSTKEDKLAECVNMALEEEQAHIVQAPQRLDHILSRHVREPLTVMVVVIKREIERTMRNVQRQRDRDMQPEEERKRHAKE